MIIEVALGVVLGVLILRYWTEILALGVFAAVVAAALIIGGGAIYWIVTNEPIFQKLLTISFLVAAFSMGAFIARLISQRTVLTPSEAGVFLTITLFLVNASLFFPWFIAKWSADADEPLLFFYLLPLVGLWIWIWLKFSGLVRERKRESKRTEKAA